MTEIAFYNLIVHLVNNDTLTEENVALKNIWGREGNIMLSLYFYRTKTSRVIDASYVHDIMDMTTEKYYTRCQDLLRDFAAYRDSLAAGADAAAEDDAPVLDFKHLEEIRDDIIILIYIAKCIDYFSEMKKRTIFDYIKKHADVENLSSQYIETYLVGLKPDIEEFYQALDNIRHKTPEAAEDLAREVVKICVSDGIMAYNEKIYIAEILQTLREHGLNPDVGL